MTWDVRLYCIQCGKEICEIEQVTTAGSWPLQPLVPLVEIKRQMLQHEIDAHGGKSE